MTNFVPKSTTATPLLYFYLSLFTSYQPLAIPVPELDIHGERSRFALLVPYFNPGSMSTLLEFSAQAFRYKAILTNEVISVALIDSKSN